MSDLGYGQHNQGSPGPGRLTETMINYLKGASPWLRFIGILSFIGCGFMVLFGVVLLIAFPIIGEFGNFSSISGIALGGLYLVLAVFAFFPSKFIYSFGARLRNYFLSNSVQELELAFKNNKSLWKFHGVLAGIFLALIPVVITLPVRAFLNGFLDS
jgi:hypothetical protein